MNIALTFLLLFGFTPSLNAEPSCVTCFKQVAIEWSIPLREQQKDTLTSLDKMRGENGLVKDAVWIKKNKKGTIQVVDLNSRAAPTNVALDLLIQAELVSQSNSNTAAKKTFSQVLTTLGKLPYHEESGLFFREYDTNGSTALQKDVSAVDNLHMAIALWTVAETFPNTPDGNKAKKMFERMDFSCFTDKEKGLLHGNLLHTNGKWKVEDYHFGNLGSEARSLYSLGHALGLFKKANPENFPKRAITELKAETVVWNDKKLLKTWDGGAFQLLLPNLLISEESLSPEMKSRFENYGDYVIAETARRKLPLPAAHSASASGINLKIKSNPKLEYIGKAGSIDLVSSGNEDLSDKNVKAKWDSVVTPHAFILAATTAPKKFDEAINQAASLKSDGITLYEPGVGWLDGYDVSHPEQGKVIPVQIALDQGMIQLSLFKMASKDGMTLSARALRHNPQVLSRLKEFYKLVDKKLEKPQ